MFMWTIKSTVILHQKKKVFHSITLVSHNVIFLLPTTNFTQFNFAFQFKNQKF